MSVAQSHVPSHHTEDLGPATAWRAWPALNRETKQAKLRLLDACLERLEDENERGELQVSADLVARFRPLVGGLNAGMPISAAINAVFDEQERHLRPRLTSPIADLHPSGSVSALTRGQARHLTDEIKTKGLEFSVLLVQAHDRKAWCALGYASWSNYVRLEFDLSRSRSYELLDHGRVLLALAGAAGMSGIPDISPYAASQVKPHLATVTARIAGEAAGTTEIEARALVGMIVEQLRNVLAADATNLTPAGPAAVAGADASRIAGMQVDIGALTSAIEMLAMMPPAASVADVLSRAGTGPPPALPAAARWLMDLITCTQLVSAERDMTSR